ncbi:uncharacterized, partial [Tachysurus ichikawai]
PIDQAALMDSGIVCVFLAVCDSTAQGRHPFTSSVKSIGNRRTLD